MVEPIGSDAGKSLVKPECQQQPAELFQGFLINHAVSIDQVVHVEPTLQVLHGAKYLAAVNGQAGQFGRPDLAQVVCFAVLKVLVKDADHPAFGPQGDLNRLVPIQQYHGSTHVHGIVPGKISRDHGCQCRDQHGSDQGNAAVFCPLSHGAISTSRLI